MKKFVFLLLTCLSAINVYSQTETADKKTIINKKNTIGVHIAHSKGNFVGYGLSGTTFCMGIDYSRRLTERWSICSGLERVAINVKEDFDFISLVMPVQFKRHYKNILFINFGPYLEAVQFRYKELDEKYLMQWGVGCKFGIGLEPEFKNGITLSLNPYVIMGYRNLQAGVSLGMGYKF